MTRLLDALRLCWLIMMEVRDKRWENARQEHREGQEQ